MSTTTTMAELPGLVGTELGTSDWHEVTQEHVNLFAEATGDHQWIHVDVERAKAESPFGGPIAHGYLTLSLLAPLSPQVLVVSDTVMGVNYGLNKVRFPSPVPVGSKVRLTATLKSVEEVAGGLQLTLVGGHRARGRREAGLHRRAGLPLLPAARRPGRSACAIAVFTGSHDGPPSHRAAAAAFATSTWPRPASASSTAAATSG